MLQGCTCKVLASSRGRKLKIYSRKSGKWSSPSSRFWVSLRFSAGKLTFPLTQLWRHCNRCNPKSPPNCTASAWFSRISDFSFYSVWNFEIYILRIYTGFYSPTISLIRFLRLMQVKDQVIMIHTGPWFELRFYLMLNYILKCKY